MAEVTSGQDLTVLVLSADEADALAFLLYLHGQDEPALASIWSAMCGLEEVQ